MDKTTASLRRTTKELKNRLTDIKAATKAVTDSKLDKTVDDANALYKQTDGKVADDKTRASLLDAIKKRDADAIAKAVKEVNESKAAKEKADAEAKAKAEQEAAAAAAQQAQASQSQSVPQRQTPSYSGGSQSQSQGSSGSGSETVRRPSSGARRPPPIRAEPRRDGPCRHRLMRTSACPAAILGSDPVGRPPCQSLPRLHG